MRKVIAGVLSLIVGAFGFTIVDKALESRVSELESRVAVLESLHEINQSESEISNIDISKEYSTTTSENEVTTNDNSCESTVSYITTQVFSTVKSENDEHIKMSFPIKGETIIVAGYPYYADGSPHWGIDIVMKNGETRGQPFYAAASGKVIIIKNDGNWNSGFGNYCVIDHGNGLQTLYAQADSITVKLGDEVNENDEIGIIGATGNVTGPHLHFEVRKKNEDGSVSRVNPLDYVSN